jgi:threonine dehydrogenase-like Zn-dependent dehydrogenase
MPYLQHFQINETDPSLGHETVGVVAAIGPDVKGFTVGERVVAE